MTAHPVLRWAAPGVAAAAVIAGAQVAMHQGASAAPKLPDRTAQQLLTDLLKAQPDGLSGTVSASTDLGLPELPSGAGGDGDASPLGLLQGDHTMRVWYADSHRARIALLGDASETDLITDGTDTWLWKSADKTAWHLKHRSDRHRMTPDHDRRLDPGDLAGAMTPKKIASLALSMIKPTTTVSTTSAVTVAGRSAYQMVFAPKDPKTTIGSVRIAIDARQHVPLRAQVFAKGSDHPAINVGFTKISFETPSASRFTFTPPPGATVHQVPARHQALPSSTRLTPGATDHHTPADLRTVGSGWSTVLVTRMPASDAGPGSTTSGVPAQLLKALPKVSGAWGSGHLMRSALVSAVITDDGRVAVGAVPPGQLYAALKRG